MAADLPAMLTALRLFEMLLVASAVPVLWAIFALQALLFRAR